MPGNRAYRNICFTAFGDDKRTIKKCLNDGIGFPDYVRYCVGQIERCPHSGKTHYQGYMEFSKKVYLSQIKVFLPTAHIEPRFGTQAQAITYVTKKDTRIKKMPSFGSPGQQGHRNDLDDMVDMVQDGHSPAEIVATHRGNAVRYGNHILTAYEMIYGIGDRVMRINQTLARMFPNGPKDSLESHPEVNGNTEHSLSIIEDDDIGHWGFDKQRKRSDASRIESRRLRLKNK